MKALVTGAAGFVGSRIVARLLQDGHEVVGADLFTDYYDQSIKRENIKRLPKFEFHEIDLVKCDAVQLMSGVDWVFHQAGQPGVRKSWGADFAEYTRQNINLTQVLLEAAAKTSSIKRFVYASSSSVYGNAQTYPTRETDLPRPLSPYGVSKLAAEHLTVLYAENFGVPTTSLRYFTVYGPGQRPDMAFTRFLLAAHQNKALQIFGTGKQIRDFTYVDDVVEANIAAAQSDSRPGSVFNVAGGSNISVNEVIDVIGDIIGSKVNVKYDTKVAGDVHRTGGDISSIQSTLGWAPLVTLDDGLRRQSAWISSLLDTQVMGA